ncbi:serpin family protein [Microbacterium sp. JZ31]|uniref:serpin family protein n=1 Tax=Microbacterium sp. JZ31 TaxID=1906274 RepID=UPI001931F3D2|nr:serpin family protein [Microbacterium sp. JZ31]
MAPLRVIGGLAALTLAASLAACGSATPSGDVLRAAGVEARTVAVTDAARLPDVVEATRRLGLATLALADRGDNVVLSPASLAGAFAMLAEGAAGESLAELDAVLGATGADRGDAWAAIRGSLAGLDGDPAAAAGDELPERPIVHLATRVVLDEGFDPRPEFLERLAETFDAGITRAELSDSTATAMLSEWIRRHTGGLIRETAIEPNADLRVVLQDVVLLAARWQAPFDPADTQDLPFTLPDGSPADTETMTAGGFFAYAEAGEWAAVRLPYTEALHADVVLPPQGADPADATPELLEDISSALDDADPVQVELALPTVDTGTTKTPLIDKLAPLGLGTLADPGSADLSGIAGSPGDLVLAQAVQQAVLRIDEEGTVAAAVTELGVAETSATLPPAREIRFDRPFLFTVSHDETGWPLFLAAIRDPRH